MDSSHAVAHYFRGDAAYTLARLPVPTRPTITVGSSIGCEITPLAKNSSTHGTHVDDPIPCFPVERGIYETLRSIAVKVDEKMPGRTKEDLPGLIVKGNDGLHYIVTCNEKEEAPSSGDWVALEKRGASHGAGDDRLLPVYGKIKPDDAHLRLLLAMLKA